MAVTEPEISSQVLSQFSEFIAGAMGLHYPQARWPDLQRGLVATAAELDFTDAATCAARLISEPLTKKRRDVLANHLTVGETYFFREPRSFEILKETILPELIRQRQDDQRRIRIWSAACCTGEEPYSIAMTLHQAIPDLQSWNVTLLATDINPRFLRKAATGVFGQWSFRDTPAWIKQRYFTAGPNGQFEISPDIRRMVSFAELNLVEDIYPSLGNDTNAMDVIFCRNVLMYFTPEQSSRVIQKLYRALLRGGWLLVSASELPHASLPDYSTVNFPGAILHRKESGKAKPVMMSTPAPVLTTVALYEQGQYSELVNTLAPAIAEQAADSASIDLLARSMANEGKLAEALDCCDRWIGAQKLNPAAHYLRSAILLEQGALEESVRSLRAALYLDSGFVLGHFAMGNIERRRGCRDAARKHFDMALQLLEGRADEEPVPESDGITTRRLVQMIQSLLIAEEAA